MEVYSPMSVRIDRVRRAQELMAKEGIDALLILTHDDYIYFFQDDRFQPRAIIPRMGDPIIICFRGEEPEIRQRLGVKDVRVFGTVGQQIKDVVTIMQEQMRLAEKSELVIGAQTAWFEVPVSLLNLFQKANPRVTVVDSGPVMDPIRAVKDEGELEHMRRAAELANLGMEAVRRHLRPGKREYEVAAEAEYAIRKEGGEFRYVPVYVNSGVRSYWLHGTSTDRVVEEGDLVIVDLVPSFKGYCINLTRTFVVGDPTPEQERLAQAYLALQDAGIAAMRPGTAMRQIDQAAQEALVPFGYESEYIRGFSHSIGLRFEETPAPTIHPPHSSLRLTEGMTVTAGHSVLVDPAIGGVRFEDTGLITTEGWDPITTYERALIKV